MFLCRAKFKTYTSEWNSANPCWLSSLRTFAAMSCPSLSLPLYTCPYPPSPNKFSFEKSFVASCIWEKLNLIESLRYKSVLVPQAAQRIGASKDPFWKTFLCCFWTVWEALVYLFSPWVCIPGIQKHTLYCSKATAPRKLAVTSLSPWTKYYQI